MAYLNISNKQRMRMGRLARHGGFAGLGDVPPSNACGTGTTADPTTGASMNMATSTCECPAGTTWDGSSMTCVAVPTSSTSTPSTTTPAGASVSAPAAPAGGIASMVAPVMNTLTLGGKIPDVVVYGGLAYAAYHFLFKKKRG